MDGDGLVHGVIIPWPVAGREGQSMAWCAAKGGGYATSPLEITCERCVRMMRQAHTFLGEQLAEMETGR